MSDVTCEKRFTTLEGVKVEASDDAIGFRGHAAMFERRTWIGPKQWGFWEQVARGAFSKSIGESDVRFLINHDPNLVLARTPTTLRLSEDSVGLAVDADLARTTYGEDLGISLERGDVTQMSFGFEVIREEVETLGDGTELRTILEANLWDVSAVTYPAYQDTDASLRAVAFDVLAKRLGISTKKRARLLAGLGHDQVDDEAVAILRDADRNLRTLLDEYPTPAETTSGAAEHREVPGTPAEPPTEAPLTLIKQRHALNAKRFGLPAA